MSYPALHATDQAESQPALRGTSTYGPVDAEARELPNPMAIQGRRMAVDYPKHDEGTAVTQLGNVVRAPELRYLREVPRIRPSLFKCVKKWECVVIQVEEDTFTARLVDASGESEDSMSAFSIDEVSRDDRRLIEPGAVFYWSIGYKENASGTRTRESILVFRRVPAWSKQALERINKESDKMLEYFKDAPSS